MEFTRAFVAVEIGDPARTVLQRLIERLKHGADHVRWTRLEQLHLTVKFLGEVDNRELPRICEQLRQACRPVEPFAVTLSGLGTFPLGKPPRIIWAGIGEGSAQISRLHDVLDAALADLGLPREGRRFRPHLTVGRVGRGANVSALECLLQEFQEAASTRFEVDEIALLASVRERGKQRYEPIDVIEL